jgi:hypothetical protein
MVIANPLSQRHVNNKYSLGYWVLDAGSTVGCVFNLRQSALLLCAFVLLFVEWASGVSLSHRVAVKIK